MGIFDRFRRSYALPYDLPEFYGAWELDSATLSLIRNMSAGEMWATQPYLRTVVTFMARNIAQLGLQTFERVSDTDRRRVRDGALVEALGRPNSATTGYELIYGLVADLALYDEAFWLMSPEPDQRLTRLPPAWVSRKGGDALTPERYVVKANDRGEVVSIPADRVLAFHGWSPGSLMQGASPVDALKEVLAEQFQAAEYRRKVWERGGKVSSAITRPAGMKWSKEARDAFRADWASKWTGTGAGVGGTPILEDGMTITKLDFSAHEQQFVEGARLALTTVAQVYHINPTMIGENSGANYSNVREFRKMLYGDTLGPVLAQIEDRINTFLVPLLDDRDGIYVEFNTGEKLQGSFEEQSSAMQTAVGAPFMLRSEARALMNLPAVEGADELVVPLNVLIGGQASPTDSGTQNVASGVALGKARAPSTHEAKHAQVLRSFFARQARVIKTALGVKADEDWWDADRWNKELAEDLLRLGVFTSSAAALSTIEALGFGASDYDADRTVNFLLAMAERISGEVNATTKAALDDALASDDPAGAVAAVFDKATGSRTDQLAATMIATMSGFGTVEAAKQVGAASKTWVTGKNPRPSHARLNGQTVPIDEPFSNGAMWPGDGPTAGEAAGCNCDVLINIS